MAPTGDIVFLCDGDVELVNPKPGDNYPRIWVIRRKLYDGDQPTSLWGDGQWRRWSSTWGKGKVSEESSWEAGVSALGILGRGRTGSFSGRWRRP